MQKILRLIGYLRTGGARKKIEMQLSKTNISHIPRKEGLVVPDRKLFDLPEKVLQFGTGVLLRGLPDYFIDKANRNGLFNGRIVVVKSTSNGGTDAFDRQDALYTLCVRGIENGQKQEEFIINSAISRVLSATKEWDAILACAHSAEMKVIISNTTEVGIVLVNEKISQGIPESFPGKLLSFLWERFNAFNGSEESGMVIIPTELIPGNGDQLKNIVLQLAELNRLPFPFTTWLKHSNHFCNSLVDRIVPGRLPANELYEMEKLLGYSDELMIMAESFRLWAIESGHPKVTEVLSFAPVDKGVIIAPDIEKFRELKLRLLNGTHTLSCGLAWLAGFSTVKDAMNNEEVGSFISKLCQQEIAEAISDDSISHSEARDFATKVLDRFRNPFLDHQWLSIAVQYTSKMRMRVVPILLRHYNKKENVPSHIALGFAAYLLFMKSSQNNKLEYKGFANNTTYLIQDDEAGFIADKWHDNDIERVVDTVLSDSSFWGTDLFVLNGFAQAIKSNLRSLLKNGVVPTIKRVITNKPVDEFYTT
jgi:tagaturonate reductase